MKRKLLASLVALLASASLSSAQLPYPAPGWVYPNVQPVFSYGYYVPQIMPLVMMPVVQAPSTAGPSFVQPALTTLTQFAPAPPDVIPAPLDATPTPVAAPTVTLPARSDAGPSVLAQPAARAGGSRFWASGEYLLWWIKDGPQSVPLVTTGGNTDADPGALGLPATRVLFGGNGFDYGSFSGGRVTLGGWFGSDRVLGFETSGFLLEQRTTGFGTATNAQGNPLLAIPFQAVSGAQQAVLVGFPLATAGLLDVRLGSITITTSSRLWGCEASALLPVAGNGAFTAMLLAGFRYIDLEEDLQIAARSEQIDNPTIARDVTAADRFATHNQFFGGQLGVKVGRETRRLSVSVAGKVALGSTHETVEISGVQLANFNTVAQAFGFVPTVSPGGIFAQRSNVGRRSQNEFAAIPEVQVKVGYNIASWMRATAGYDFLYWGHVARPGDQIDPVINVRQPFAATPSALNLGFSDNSLGTRPSPLFNKSDFWAQGVSFGLEFRY